MFDIKSRPWLRYGCACLLVAGGLGAVAFQAPAVMADQVAGGDVAAVEVNPNAPEVEVLEDGRLVQRTPNSSGDFNTRILMGDDRGCGACHDDLAATLEGMMPETEHLLIASGVDTDLGVEQCLTCHHEGQYQQSLGTLLHAMHNVGVAGQVADCFSCHDANALDNEMTLWDMVKYDRLNGIRSISNVEGEFTWTQDTVIPVEELFNAGWGGGLYETLGYEDALGEEVPPDPELFDTWTISITGAVGEEMTWTLPELIEQAPSVTRLMKEQCDVNPLGGSMIGQVEITGIPVSWLVEQAGLTDEARAVTFQGPDGGHAYYGNSLNMDEFLGREAYLVYEMNGERLPWKNGYPVQVWITDDYAARFRKQVSEVRIMDERIQNVPERATGSSRAENKPNVSVIGVAEGQCIQAGEPFTFEGYADGFEQHVKQVEFSMDGGNTWTVCETPNVDASKWVTWTFTWTPPADVDAAYVLCLRAVTEEGRTTPEPVKLMVNAKADLAQFSADVMAQTESE